jgi:hypothetical protein
MNIYVSGSDNAIARGEALSRAGVANPEEESADSGLCVARCGYQMAF